MVMDQLIIGKAIDEFLAHHILRDFEFMSAYWVRLLLCEIVFGSYGHFKKQGSYFQGIRTEADLIDHIADFSGKHKHGVLIPMTFAASHDAKNSSKGHMMDKIYGFKHFLQNILIILFNEEYTITAAHSGGMNPTLELPKTVSEGHMISISFHVGYLLKGVNNIKKNRASPMEGILMHLPRLHMMKEVEEIVDGVLSGREEKEEVA
jgi:hypothetical protein